MSVSVYFPAYYADFRCIADKCSHSCCVGWEIGVDGETLNRYKGLDSVLGEEIRSHICASDSTIRLLPNGRCPFLDGSGLCRIISQMGDGAVSLICREHPRFYHKVNGRIEGGIGAVCEEACRIILSSDSFADFVEIPRIAEAAVETDFDSIPHRDYIYSVLKNADLSYTEKLDFIKKRYNIPEFFARKEEWREVFSSLEYLDEGRRGAFDICDSIALPEREDCFIRFFAYLVFRHVSVARDYDNLRARVGYCLLLLSLLHNMSKDGKCSFDALIEHVRVVSEEIEYSEDNTDSLIFELECLV